MNAEVHNRTLQTNAQSHGFTNLQIISIEYTRFANYVQSIIML